MKSVWILQTGEPIPGDRGNPRKLRAFNLAEKLAKKDIKVVVWSSRFDHAKKKKRDCESVYEYSDLIEVRLLESPGYAKNISFARILDHLYLTYDFRKKLKLEKEVPDLLFVGFPPIELAFTAIAWAKRKSIPTILDFKDLWPDIFLNIFPKRFRQYFRFLISPFSYFAKKAIQNTDSLISISEPFLNKARDVFDRPESDYDRVIPLSTGKKLVKKIDGKAKFDEILDKIELDNSKDIVISFAGTFMNKVFDFALFGELIEALRVNNFNLKVLLAGNGDELEFWKKHYSDQDSIFFLGWIDPEIITKIYDLSLAIIIPLKDREDFSLSIPNKAIDALANEKIILTGNPNYLSTYLEQHECGYLYSSAEDLSDFLINLKRDSNLKNYMEANARKVYQEHFEFDKTYENLTNLISDLIIKND